MASVDGVMRRHATDVYIGSVVLLWGLLSLACFSYQGWPTDWASLGVLALLGSLTWWLPTSSDGRSHFTADNVVVLAAIPVVGVLGAGMVGLVMTGLTTRRIPLRRRVFNMAMTSSSAMVGGLAYAWAGGSFTPASLRGAADLTWHVGLPVVAADVVNLVVIMWRPGDLGPVSILVALVPLAGARWALLQYGEERAARERALGALVSAIETRAPELEGHSARVSTLAALMAQELGLGPKEVADVRTAGLLHDLGRVVVAPGQEGEDAVASARLRGVSMLQDLPFLHGASSLMEEVARVELDDTTPSLAADLVRTADEYDLMRHRDGVLDPGTVLERLRSSRVDAQGDRVLQALGRAVRDVDLPGVEGRAAS